ncbi:hypothetical protein RQP46_001027 [Phenoliferia psychrophenolica]
MSAVKRTAPGGEAGSPTKRGRATKEGDTVESETSSDSPSRASIPELALTSLRFVGSPTPHCVDGEYPEKYGEIVLARRTPLVYVRWDAARQAHVYRPTTSHVFVYKREAYIGHLGSDHTYYGGIWGQEETQYPVLVLHAATESNPVTLRPCDNEMTDDENEPVKNNRLPFKLWTSGDPIDYEARGPASVILVDEPDLQADLDAPDDCDENEDDYDPDEDEGIEDDSANHRGWRGQWTREFLAAVEQGASLGHIERFIRNDLFTPGGLGAKYWAATIRKDPVPGSVRKVVDDMKPYNSDEEEQEDDEETPPQFRLKSYNISLTVQETIMSILVLNPNTTVAMTDGLKVVISQLTSTAPTYYTAPSGVASINSWADCRNSSIAVLSSFRGTTLLSPSTTSGILVCCYSVHPLVAFLKEATPVPVVGIFEASVSTALLLLPKTDSTFGIVSTGKVWEGLLSSGVERYLGAKDSKRFAGVETTGLSAIELHETSPAEVRERMVQATRRLVARGGVGAVLLGCAGMVGMEEWVREACVLELGEVEGRKVHIVDGVKVGFAMLDALVKAAKVV